jgi:hypothetical protein
MRRFLHILITVLFTVTLVSANTSSAFATSGDDEHAMEMEVNGYHVKLASLNEWKKGETTIIVTLMDSMGMPVQNANVELLIASKTDEHSASDNAHGIEEQQGAMPGMEIGSDTSHDSMPGMEMEEDSDHASSMPAHDEQTAEPIVMTESDDAGMYTLETHLESSGEHEVNVMFHVNGEMLQAVFLVDILQNFSKSLVLWGFAAVNAVFITIAGIQKKQSISVKGR